VTQTPGSLAVDLNSDADGVVAVVSGDLDMATSRSLTAAVRGAVDPSNARLLTLDLSGVGFCDSAGISALVEIRQSCIESGWRLRVVRLQPNVRRVIVDFTGLGEYLDVQ
jgi:anti-sigma B factor antagonist